VGVGESIAPKSSRRRIRECLTTQVSRAADTEAFLAAVETIYEAAARPSKWPDALQASAAIFDDIGANLIWQRDDGSFGTLVSPGLRTAQADYESGWWRQDIRAIRAIEYAFGGNAGAITDRHVVTPEEIETHPYYAEFQPRHGLKWIASVQISPDPYIIVALSVQRAASKAPYSDEELGVLSRLGGHAEHALRLGIRLLGTELTNASLGDAISRIGVGAFVLDGLGRVVFSNPAGERLIGEGLHVANERLFAPGAEGRKLEVALSAVLHAESVHNPVDPRPILLRGPGEDQQLAIYLLPVRSHEPAIDPLLARARVIMLAIALAPGKAADPAIIRDMLGLTLGEARIAAHIGSGLAPRETAARLGITEGATRTTLKRVFSKLGVSRQSELAVLLTRLVPR
jgi:DNA-binding CsgD family transcriptional regulator/PAS domain-containing protein